MNIAIPVSAHDKHLLPTFVKVLQHFGGLEDTPICFFSTPSAKAETYEAATALNATVHTFEVDFAGGWPVASGSHFAATVFTLPKIGWNAPWLWMELDMLPVQKGWLQSLRNGYQLCGKPFMGNVVPTAWVEDGKLVVKEDDDMMMGCGVYPANMHADERFRPLLADLVKPPPRNPNTPFDFYLRHAMRHAGFADTKLIADMWQTCEYKRTGKGITCKPVSLDKPRRERGGLVPSEAVIVHGCKDGTLAELVLADNPLAYKIVSPKLPASYAENLKTAKVKPVGELGEILHANIIVTSSLPPGVDAVVVGNEPPSDRREQVAGAVAALAANPEKAPLLEKMLEVNMLPPAAEVVRQLKQEEVNPAKKLPLPLIVHIAEQASEPSPVDATAAVHPDYTTAPYPEVQQIDLAKYNAPGKVALEAPTPVPEDKYLPAPTVTDANGTHTLDVAILKPKPTRTAVEALRKSKKGVAVEIARALNLSIGDFAKLLPTLGYVIAKGGKLKSTV